MSQLTLYSAQNATQSLWQSDNPVAIADKLAGFGLSFRQWPVSALPDEATAEQILACYQSQITQLKLEAGYQTADVVSLHADHPDKATLRQKFLAEHSHQEDEVRFFVRGQGLFCFHIQGQVLQLLCTQGDLISVPAGTLHWFDMGSAPCFTAIRLFTDPTGWVAQFSGSPIAEQFPLLD
ncbi:acireductone dioxygenase [Rheinheimera sp.]|uniref:1,2-dihydroxy-3-keto-5-methylthiopentene dioxygenase n=1 Tax=Rheinheimera sp. TaxID=1869214 RepID=UPI00307E9FB7